MSNKRLQTHADCGSMHKTCFWFDLIFLQQTPPPIFYYLRRFSPLVPPILPYIFSWAAPAPPDFSRNRSRKPTPTPPEPPADFSADFRKRFFCTPSQQQSHPGNRRRKSARKLAAKSDRGHGARVYGKPRPRPENAVRRRILTPVA